MGSLPGVEELMGKRRSGPTAPHSGVSAAQRGGLQADAVKPRRAQQGKNWTFPNARSCGAADPFLCTAGGMPPVCSPSPRRGASPDPPPPLPPPLSAGSSRTPSASDVGDEGSAEVRSRGGGCGPPGLEHSESLSDSLYDSLSSCGSQG